MKVWIISKEKNVLATHIEEHFEIPRYELKENSKELPKIIRENKEWIIETSFINNLSILANQATIIFLIKESETKGLLKSIREATLLNELSKEEKDFIKKYRSKIILLKNKKEINKCIEALDKDENYWY